MNVNIKSITKMQRDNNELKQKIIDLEKIIQNNITLIDSVPNLFILVDTDGKILLLNESIAKSLGGTKEDLTGKIVLDYFPPEVAKNRTKMAHKLIKTKKPITFEDKRDRRWFKTKLFPVLDSKGNVNQIVTMVDDTTEHKKIELSLEKKENKLKESEEKFRMLSYQALMGIGIIQGEQIKYANNAISSITGYTKEEFISEGTKILSKIVHPDDLSFVSDQLQKKLSGKKDIVNRYVCRIITKNNNIKWLEIFSKTIYYEGKYADLITFVDITESKIAEENVRESEEKYRSIFESASEAITISDNNGKILDVNSAALEILGYESEELIGKIAAPGYVYPEQRKEMRQKLMKNGFVRNQEITFKHKDGLHVNVLGSATLLKNKNGQIDRIIGIFTDITNRVKAEQEIKKTKDYLQNVIDSASEIIFTIGSDYKIKTWNKSARMITGYKQSHIIGKSIKKLTLIENQDELKDYIQTIFKGKISKLEELTINTSFGIKKQFSVSPSFIRDESKNVNEILFVCRDISYEKERHGKLLFGQSYLISEATSKTALDIFTEMLRIGHPGLYIARTSNIEIKNIFTDVSPTVVKLSMEKDMKQITCSNFEEILSTIEEYVTKEKQPIVLLDRIEYLIINSSFESVIRNIYRLNDIIGKHNCLLLLRISPSLLDKTQMVILKEEFQQLPERQIDDIQLEETLFEILEYIQIENSRNSLVSYSRISKQFSISKVTSQRRIESLIEKGLIFLKKQGRTKILYVTDKGKNFLDQRSAIKTY